jgi:hypothetical protein
MPWPAVEPRVAAVGSRRLIAWDTARSLFPAYPPPEGVVKWLKPYCGLPEVAIRKPEVLMGQHICIRDDSLASYIPLLCWKWIYIAKLIILIYRKQSKENKSGRCKGIATLRNLLE